MSQTTAAHSSALVPSAEESYVPENLIKADKRITTNPYDTEAWSVIIRFAQSRNVEDARTAYERLVTQFPTSGRYWKIYIEHEMRSRNYEKVEKLFQRCLIRILNIDLWKTYLNYIRETKGNLPSFREKMAQAYDFSLDKIGMDVNAYHLWVEYINFLKSVEAVGSYAENQRITAVRKVYQRAVVTPMANIELLWKDYCTFENGVNPIIAKRMIDDRVRDYSNAKRVAKEYDQFTKGLNRNAASVPPRNSSDEIKQVDLWKKYIKWEKENVMRTEDQSVTSKRVMFAYEQALLCFGHHPDFWMEAAMYLEQSSKILSEKGDQNAGKLFADEAASMYERATTTLMKSNPLVYFAYADFEESRMKYDKVHTIYKKLVATKDIDPTLGYIHYIKFARRAEGIKSARAIFKMAREDNRSLYHVYIVAALMEYYCSKDKVVSHRIFELGLKKFGDKPDYIITFLNFMNNLNEDNNTRVLFEKVLSSGQMSEEDSVEVWNKFLEFESNVGDLASIQKVEKRRSQLISKDLEDKDTALLIDRYCYMDLLPCNSSELESLGYNELARKQKMSMPQLSKQLNIAADDKKSDDSSAPKFPMPDVSMMMPFKPRVSYSKGAHPTPGGVFPVPLAAADLMLKLPPPNCFQGPFVAVDKFMDHLKKLKLTSPNVENGLDPAKLDAGTLLAIDYAMGRKRKISHSGMNDGDSGEEDNMVAPPTNDIYRQRQQKKAK